MRFRWLPLSALALALTCSAQEAGRLDQIVQSYFARQQFSGAVLVARDGQVLFSKGYGLANAEWNIPNTPDTKFRLGSISKQFTSACILLLQERGKLKLDDHVKVYLPDAPAAWDQITIYNLLTHTSGLPDFTRFPDYRKLEPFATTPAELVARFKDKPLDFAPGTQWSYSNSGYVLLTYLLEKISGEKYPPFVTENIFQPLGMTDSGYDSNTAVIAHRASGYVRGKDGLQNAGYINMTIPQGAGALYSTPNDLLKWEQGLFGGRLLKPESLAQMTTPFKSHYALGLMVVQLAGHQVTEHTGGIEGFNTFLLYAPDEKITAVALSNVNGSAVGQIGNKLAQVAMGESVTLPGERKEITVEAATLSHYAGAYELQPGIAMLIRVENGQLISQLTGQGPVPFFAETDTRFFAKVVDAELDFSGMGPEGVPAQLTLHQNGRDAAMTRLDEAQATKLAAARQAE